MDELRKALIMALHAWREAEMSENVLMLIIDDHDFGSKMDELEHIGSEFWGNEFVEDVRNGTY